MVFSECFDFPDLVDCDFVFVVLGVFAMGWSCLPYLPGICWYLGLLFGIFGWGGYYNLMLFCLISLLGYVVAWVLLLASASWVASLCVCFVIAVAGAFLGLRV